MLLRIVATSLTTLLLANSGTFADELPPECTRSAVYSPAAPVPAHAAKSQVPGLNAITSEAASTPVFDSLRSAEKQAPLKHYYSGYILDVF